MRVTEGRYLDEPHVVRRDHRVTESPSTRRIDTDQSV